MISKPYHREDGVPGSAVTLTSCRVDHFKKMDDAAVQAFDTVVSFIKTVLLEVQKNE